MRKKYYKVLKKDRMPYAGVGQWHRNKWMPAVKVEPCFSGYHLCDIDDLRVWIGVGEELWEAKGRGQFSYSMDKIVFSEARLVRKLKWNKEKFVKYAKDCIEKAIEERNIHGLLKLRFESILIDCVNVLDDEMRDRTVSEMYALAYEVPTKAQFIIHAMNGLLNFCHQGTDGQDAIIYSALTSEDPKAMEQWQTDKLKEMLGV